MSKTAIALVFVCKFSVCAVCLWALGFFVFLLNVPTKQPDLQALLAKRTEPIDAIVVLTGGRSRTKCAIDLLEKQYASNLFVSGVNKCVSLQDLSVHMHDRDFSYCKTSLGYKAQDTVGNAHEIKQFLQERGFKSLILVTSDYHMLRSLILFRYAEINAEIIPYPVFSRKRKGKWLILALREYNAIVCLIPSILLKRKR
ncbi:MAG: YdcF family protein [Holosporales bacterium]|nr:YdcF family protein [Holosporales bacterium]